MVEIFAIVTLTILGVMLILLRKELAQDGFSAGIIIMLFGFIESVLLEGDPVPQWIGVVGFGVLGSIEIMRRFKIGTFDKKEGGGIKQK